MEQSRAPLRDIVVNSPSLKRQKLNNSTAQEVKSHFTAQLLQEIKESKAQTEQNKVEHILHHEEQLEIAKREAEEAEAEAQLQLQLEHHQLELQQKKQHDLQTKASVEAQQQDAQNIPLPEWQRKWRRIMRESVIYFDSNDLSVSEGSKKKEKEKAIRIFTQVGATIQPFFDHRVTIFVTNRAKNELPRNIQTQPQSSNAPHPLKFWNYDKVFRFLKHLGENSSPEKQQPHHQAKHLFTLLQDEKLHGTNDRDPNAKRDDFNYFKYPYIYVYDLRQVTKPVTVREWKIKETSSDKKPWPHLFESTYGHSLFQPDPSNINDPRKKERRRLRDDMNKDYRDKLKAVYSKNPPELESMNSDSESDEFEEVSYIDCEEDEDDSVSEMPPPRSNTNQNISMSFPPSLGRTNSVLMNKFIESNKRDNFEIEASGYTGSGNTGTNQSNEFSKNGLVATTSTVNSKEVSSLHRRLIEKKSKLSLQEQQQLSNKTKVAGYCENCRIHFEDFDEHCVCASHRAFAQEDSNFDKIDELIEKLQENIQNKKV